MSTWIPISVPGSRLPTREDADELGEVVWKWADSIAMIARWDEALCDPQPVAWLHEPRTVGALPVPQLTEADVRRIVRLENELLFKTTAAARAPAPERPRFVKLGADGKPTTGDHVAVWDRQSGLVHTAAPLLNGKDLNHADALRACAELELLGQKGWQLPYLMDLLSLIDYDRYDPAVDTAHFKGPFGWTWTRTPYKGNVSGASWIVYLYDGGASWYGHGGHDHVRAVLAGQQLGLEADARRIVREELAHPASKPRGEADVSDNALLARIDAAVQEVKK